jgi:glutamate-5-semialdehyde dehydrogenase
MTIASAEFLFKNTRQASKALRLLNSNQRSALVKDISDALLDDQEELLRANEIDLSNMDPAHPTIDRLRLTDERILALSQALAEVATLPDPHNKVIRTSFIQDGLQLELKHVAMGVVGVIYESRPNVTADVAGLCLRSANAVILKGGKEAHHSNQAIVHIIHKVLLDHQLPVDIVTLLPTDRSYTESLLKAAQYVDLIIPRGSDGLIQYVRDHSRIPTIETGAGVCHTYVHSNADLHKACDIVVNAKTSRPSVCNAMDTLIVDRSIALNLFGQLAPKLAQWQVEIYADEHAFEAFQALGYPFLQKAAEEDFGREFLDYKCSIKVAGGYDDAIAHIEKYSSGHSECIVTEHDGIAAHFLDVVDAAAVYHNASTRFTDGGVYGLGAEIGISTQKLHARGPFALEKLVTEKWVVKGNGHIR